MAGRFSVEAIFKAVDRVSAPVTRMQNRVGQFTRSMETDLTKVTKKMDSIGDSLKKGALYAGAAIGTVSVALADAINVGAEFEQTLVTAASKFGGIKKGSAVFKQLEEAARKAGSTTEFTASQSAQALTELAAAGFDVNTAIAALPKVIDLATAAQVDLGMATQMVSDSMGAFGLNSKDPVQAVKNMTRVMDVMSATADASTLDFEQVFESFKKAGPIATAAGLNIETVASMLGLMGNAGIKAELAGTAVQNMLLNMASPSRKAADMMKKLGVSFKDSSGKFKDLPVILDSLNKSMANMTAPQKAAALETLFGREGLAGMVAVVSAGGDKFKEFRSIVENALGSTSDKAAMMRDTFQGSMKSLDSAIEGVKISIFSMNSGPLKEVVDRMTDWIRANGELIATKIGGFLKMLIDNLDTIVTWTKRIGIAIGIFVTLTTVLRTFVLVMTAVNLVMAMNPIVWIVAAIALFITAIIGLIAWLSSLNTTTVSFGDILRAVVEGVAWGASAVMSAWAPVKQFFIDLWDGITNGFKIALDTITSIVNKITEMVGAVVNTVSGIGGDVAGFFGFGDTPPTPAVRPAAQMVSPQERIARNIEEKRTSAEVTITDRTGTAQVSRSTMGGGLKLNKTGSF